MMVQALLVKKQTFAKLQNFETGIEVTHKSHHIVLDDIQLTVSHPSLPLLSTTVGFYP